MKLDVDLLAQDMAAGDSSAVGVTAQQLLQHVGSRTWHATNPQLHAVRRAVAKHVIQRANAAQLASATPAVLDPEAYVINGAAVGRRSTSGRGKCYVSAQQGMTLVAPFILLSCCCSTLLIAVSSAK